MPVYLVRLARRYLLRHPWQTMLMVVGITLGVAVAVAVDLANASASRAFALSTEAVAGKATHFISGGPTGIDEAIYTKLKRAGIQNPMAPILTAYISAPRLGSGLFQLLGVDPFAETPFRNYLSQGQGGPVVNDLLPFLTKPGAILLSSAVAQKYDLKPGDTFDLFIDGRSMPVTLTGIINPADSLTEDALSTLVLADISTAQEITHRTGYLDRIDLILPENGSAVLQEKIKNLLPKGANLLPVNARTGAITQMTGAFQLNLTALSLLALVVGLFLIYNTITFSVVQRRALFGTLRCLGATRLDIFFLVLGEAALVGLVGSLFGVVLGIILGQGAVHLVTQTINDLFFVVSVEGVQVPFTSLVKGMMLGIIATVFSAAPPAWEAASVPARLALSRSGLEGKARRAVLVAAWAGIGILLLGGLVLSIPTNNLVISFVGTFCVILGCALLAPVSTLIISRVAMPVSQALWGTLGRMAPRNVAASLSRTSVAVAALMVAVSVTIGVSLMVGSFRYTVVVWLAEVLRGDIYVSTPSITGAQTSAPIAQEVINRLESWPGVEQLYRLRAVTVDSPQGPIQISASDNADLTEERLFVYKAYSIDEIKQQMQAGGVLVSEPLANRLNLASQTAFVSLFTDEGPRSFPVLGVFYDYGSPQGSVLMTLQTYHMYWRDDVITAISLKLQPGRDPASLSSDLRDSLSSIQLLNIRPNLALRNEVMQIFDRTFAITGALQILATLVAFIGILSALLSLELERQKEMGILRSVGLTVRQLWQLISLETGLLGLVAGLLSMPTGYVLALILIYIINRRSFGWTLQMQISPDPFVQAVGIAMAAALLAGIYPAYRMGKMITAEAMRFE